MINLGVVMLKMKSIKKYAFDGCFFTSEELDGTQTESVASYIQNLKTS